MIGHLLISSQQGERQACVVTLRRQLHNVKHAVSAAKWPVHRYAGRHKPLIDCSTHPCDTHLKTHNVPDRSYTGGLHSRCCTAAAGSRIECWTVQWHHPAAGTEAVPAPQEYQLSTRQPGRLA